MTGMGEQMTDEQLRAQCNWAINRAFDVRTQSIARALLARLDAKPGQHTQAQATPVQQGTDIEALQLAYKFATSRADQAEKSSQEWLLAFRKAEARIAELEAALRDICGRSFASTSVDQWREFAVNLQGIGADALRSEALAAPSSRSSQGSSHG